MDSSVAADKSTVDSSAFAFVQSLAKDLNGDAIEIPAFPDIAMRVRAVLADENSTADKIARVVGSEPGLAARLVKMANSAALNRSDQKVLDVKTAVNRLGHNQIRASATAFAMKNVMDYQSVERLKPFLAHFWNHSIHVAAIAFSLARRTETVNPDEAMFVGLVHDIGKLYILTKIEDHPALLGQADKLTDILRDWHTPVGKAILENWDFPAHALEAVEHHHDLDRRTYSGLDLTDVITVANLCSNSMTSTVDFASVRSYQRFALDEQEFQIVMAESKNEIEEQMRALRG